MIIFRPIKAWQNHANSKFPVHKNLKKDGNDSCKLYISQSSQELYREKNKNKSLFF